MTTKNDMISRAAQLNDLSYCAPELWQDEEYIKAKIMKQPPVDAVPVIRCRDCNAWEIDWRPNHSKDDEHFCPMISLVTSGEWFCAYGERRNDDAEC